MSTPAAMQPFRKRGREEDGKESLVAYTAESSVAAPKPPPRPPQHRQTPLADPETPPRRVRPEKMASLSATEQGEPERELFGDYESDSGDCDEMAEVAVHQVPSPPPADVAVPSPSPAEVPGDVPITDEQAAMEIADFESKCCESRDRSRRYREMLDTIVLQCQGPPFPCAANRCEFCYGRFGRGGRPPPPPQPSLAELLARVEGRRRRS